MSEFDEDRIGHMLDAASTALRLAHGRTRSDLDVLWQTAESDLPALVLQLESHVTPESTQCSRHRVTPL